ncbi:MAG: tetratricopeptide repeat protein [Planctomycetaceae bacterium]
MVVFYEDISGIQPLRDRFEVRFTQPAFRFISRRLLNFFGKGTLYLLETGLVVDGNLPRVSLPFIDRWYHSIVGAPTSRTIPYSMIVQHGNLVQRLVLFAKVMVLLILLPAELALIASLFLGANLVLLLPITAVAVLLFAAMFYGRPHYQIVFSDPQGRRLELILGLRDKELRTEFQRQLTRFIKQAKELEHPESQSFARSLRTHSDRGMIRSRNQDSTSRWVASGLLHAWLLGCAGLMTALFLHLTLSLIGAPADSGSIVIPVIRDVFYQPGFQLHALLSNDVVIHAATLKNQTEYFSSDHLFVMLLWAFLAGLVGLIWGVARPTPETNSGTAARLAIWLPIATVCIFFGWNVRQYLHYDTIVESDSDAAAPVFRAPPIPPNDLPPRGSRTAAEYNVYLQTIQSVRRMAGAAVERSRRFEQQQNFADAEGELQKVLALAQRHGDDAQAVALIRLIAQTLNNSGNFHESQRWLEQAIPLTEQLSGKPQDSALLHNLAAVTLQGLKHPEGAVQHFQKAVELLGSEPKAEFLQNAVVIQTNYAQQLQLLSEFASARTQFDRVLSKLAHEDVLLPAQLQAGCLLASADNLAALGRSGEAFNHAFHAGKLARELEDQPNADTGKQILAMANTVKMISFWNTVGAWFGVSILVVLTLPVACSAGRRGYSALTWLVVGACSGFPMANLAVLASIPDRRLEIQRQQLRKRMQKFARREVHDSHRQGRQQAEDISIGDQPTVFE